MLPPFSRYVRTPGVWQMVGVKVRVKDNPGMKHQVPNPAASTAVASSSVGYTGLQCS